MSEMIPQTLRTGLVGETTDDPEPMNTVAALLRVFMKESMTIAGRCTLADERRVVTAVDIKNALMYCARTFFEKETLDALITEERRLMDEEEDEEEEELGEEEEDEGEDEEALGAANDNVATDRDRQLRRNVQTIVDHWHLWKPTDPVHQLIKRAIDNTPV